MKQLPLLKRLRSALVLTFSLCGAGFASAQTVAWGGSLSDTPLSYTSDGEVDNGGPGTETLIWTLGYFTGGFVPTATNYDQWVANYVATSETSSHRFEGGAWTTQHNTANVGAAAVGQQMYTFAYNSLAAIGTPAGEALLFRQIGLTFPDVPNQVTFDIEDNPSSTSDDNFEVVWGRVDRNMSAVGGVITGGGVFSSLVPDSDGTNPTGSGAGTFETQSATFVPEGSTVLLSLLGATVALRRRRR